MAVEAVVDVKSAWLSKINFGEVVKIIAMVSAAFFGVDISPEMQVHILQGIIGFGAIYTWAMKTFFTSTVTPSSVSDSSVIGK